MSKSDKSKAPLDDAESLADANTEIQADIEARAPAAEGSVTLQNLQANPMSALGLTSYGETTLSAEQLAADPRLVGKVERALLLGLIKVVG